MAAPLLQAQINIDPRSPGVALVSDLSRMPQWTACRMMKPLGPVRQAPGRSTSTVATDSSSGRRRARSSRSSRRRKVAFRVIQQHDLELRTWPTDTGTRVVESRHAENGVKPISNVAINAFMGGVPNFEGELVDGMNETLSRIKAAAEG